MELMQQLVSNLGIQEEQAKGGAGLLFQLAKDKLGADEFSQVASHVPEMDDLLSAAPQSGGGGITGAIGGIASALGGKAGGLGQLAILSGGFSKLGLDTGMIGKFVPVVLSFVQGKGGEQAKGLLERVLSPS